MTKTQQKRFVREMSRTIEADMIAKIRTDKIPATWDGHELRCLLADNHKESASMSHVRQNPKSSRAKDYKNTVIIQNL